MKQMEYTIKVVTNGPIDPNDITDVITEAIKGSDAVCTNFRVVPEPKKAKS